jgi:threonine/homoserine/homoserine lactone efflux protein
MNWCGAAFLLWLAWKIATSGHASDVGAAKPVGFVEAALFQWINPKGWLVAVGAASTYLQSSGDNPITQAVLFGVLFFAAAFPSGLLWLVLGAIIHRWLRDEKSARIFNVAMGVALAASVLMMFR